MTLAMAIVTGDSRRMIILSLPRLWPGSLGLALLAALLALAGVMFDLVTAPVVGGTALPATALALGLAIGIFIIEAWRVI